jgi:LPXTG-motif cell wall-anchored protein
MAQMEARMAKIEAYLRLDEPAAAPTPVAPGNAEDELESKLGQEWFAKAGITALGIGVAFTLSLPYRDLPAAAPSLIGFLLAAGFSILGRWWRHPSKSVAGYVQGSALALFYFSTLRLSFFGDRHAVSADSVWGAFFLASATAVSLGVALRRKSSWIFALALVTGYATALAVGSVGFTLTAFVALPAVSAAVSIRFRRPTLVLAAMPIGYAAFILWAVNDPILGRPIQLASGPNWAPGVLLAGIAANAIGLFPRADTDRETGIVNAGTLCNAAGGYGIFLLLTLASFEPRFVIHQVCAAAVLLGLAVGYSRKPNAVGSFLYALTGYLALSFAIVKAAPVPEVFVWLSLQSLLVVATAIGFRSRFIIVANFFIYLAILVGYISVARQEHGISIGFGLVALGTARLLGWQKDRLELKTERMRNAYLVTAFGVFPYALYHLVPRAYVGVAWVGAALLYYLLGVALRNRKYRWMGHATLLLTAGYLGLVGAARLDPLYRNASFLILGAVLLTVSLLFTRRRKRDK